MTAQIHRATFQKDCGWTAIARVYGPDGALITQAKTTAITYTVKRYNEGANTVVVDGASLTVSAVVFDTLQGADGADSKRWSKDNTGYNFLTELPKTAFPAVDHYEIEFDFDPSSGQDFKVSFAGPAIGVA